MNIGQRIKMRRKELGMSVDRLAELINKNRATIYRYEKNEIENTTTVGLDIVAYVRYFVLCTGVSTQKAQFLHIGE